MVGIVGEIVAEEVFALDISSVADGIPGQSSHGNDAETYVSNSSEPRQLENEEFREPTLQSRLCSGY